MLPSLDFKGTTEVVNKGVDITLLTCKEKADVAYSLTRYLSVCGYSVAVLSVTELNPVDMRTISYYEATTPLLMFMDESVGEAVIPLLDSETNFICRYEYTYDELLREIPKLIKVYRK